MHAACYAQERMLRALSAADKQALLALFESIERTFSPFWDEYPPFKQLRGRMEATRGVLAQGPALDPKGKGGG